MGIGPWASLPSQIRSPANWWGFELTGKRLPEAACWRGFGRFEAFWASPKGDCVQSRQSTLSVGGSGSPIRIRPLTPAYKTGLAVGLGGWGCFVTPPRRNDSRFLNWLSVLEHLFPMPTQEGRVWLILGRFRQPQLSFWAQQPGEIVRNSVGRKHQAHILGNRNQSAIK